MTRLDGLRIVSFESRRSEDMASLVRRSGGELIQAPSMRESPLTDQHEAIAFGERLLAGDCEVLILLTGVGTRMLVDAISTNRPRADVLAALGAVQLVCRGPKPVAALKEMKLTPALQVPEPNTWRDLLAALDASLPVARRRVFVQEYGRRNPELLAGLEARGAAVTAVPVYGYVLPDDTAPLERAVLGMAAREIDAALFTSAQQIEHLFVVAQRLGRTNDLRRALQEHVLVCSIGPITNEALAERQITADVVPEHPKMGHLVQAVARQARSVLAAKRR